MLFPILTFSTWTVLVFLIGWHRGCIHVYNLWEKRLRRTIVKNVITDLGLR
jgi:hypothetical protein